MNDFVVSPDVQAVVGGADWPESRSDRYVRLLRQVDILEAAGQVADERTQQELDDLFAAMTDHERLRAMGKYLKTG